MTFSQYSDTTTEGYMILVTIQSEPKLQNLIKNLISNYLMTTKKYLKIQVVNSNTDCHFRTPGINNTANCPQSGQSTDVGRLCLYYPLTQSA